MKRGFSLDFILIQLNIEKTLNSEAGIDLSLI